jgi:hypothetical protein
VLPTAPCLCLDVFAATKFNKTFSGGQRRQGFKVL